MTNHEFHLKRSLATGLLIFICLAVNAQNKIGMTFSQNFSTFKFTNSSGSQTDLSYTIKYGYGASFQKVFADHILTEGFLAYNVKGANSTAEHELVDWSFHYLNAGANAGYRFNFGNFHPLAGVGLYYGYLIRADQFFGETYYNLIAEGDIKRNDFGVNLFAGAEYEYSSGGSVFFRINEALGLMQLEKSENTTQKMYNRTFSIQLGLQFVISKTE
jgi:hypothetical protein